MKRGRFVSSIEIKRILQNIHRLNYLSGESQNWLHVQGIVEEQLPCEDPCYDFGTEEPIINGLELTFDDIANVPVADASSVSDWNTFFDLPTNGNPFTSVVIDVNKVTLIGGSGITIKDYLFASNNNLLNVVDSGCIQAIGVQSFRGCYGLTNPSFNYTLTIDVGGFTDCINLVNPSFTSLLSAGDYCFDNCTSLASTLLSFPSLITVGNNCFSYCNGIMELYMPVLENLGTSTLNNDVFDAISGQTIILTIPAALMTCNGGNPDGDIQVLQTNNTLTIVTI